jgi:hypothetical protein
MEVFFGVVLFCMYAVCLVLYIGVTILVGFWWFLLLFKIYLTKYKAEFKKWLEE